VGSSYLNAKARCKGEAVIGTVEEKKRHYATMPKWRGDYLREKAQTLMSKLTDDLESLDVKNLRPYRSLADEADLEALYARLGSIIRMLKEADEFDIFKE